MRRFRRKTESASVFSKPEPKPPVSEATRILAIDPATSSGYAVFDRTPEGATLVSFGFFDTTPSSETRCMGDVCLDYRNAIIKLLVEFTPSEVAIEDYFFNKNTRGGANVNPALRAIAHLVIRERGIHYEVVNPLVWKRFVTGNSSATKEDITKHGKTTAEKARVKNALAKHWGLTLPEKVKSEKTGREIKFRFDISDAIGIGVFSCWNRWGALVLPRPGSASDSCQQ